MIASFENNEPACFYPPDWQSNEGEKAFKHILRRIHEFPELKKTIDKYHRKGVFVNQDNLDLLVEHLLQNMNSLLPEELRTVFNMPLADLCKGKIFEEKNDFADAICRLRLEVNR